MKTKFQEELLEGIIIREYQAMYPDMEPNMREKAITKYQTDNFLHNRVQSLVSGVLSLIEKHGGMKNED
jgi:asparagine synthetase A